MYALHFLKTFQHVPILGGGRNSVKNAFELGKHPNLNSDPVFQARQRFERISPVAATYALPV